ncbi:iron-containing alcohol dehydrogenase [Anaerosacchariphilus sp. NSJ-68]|uniref:Iron-containing alcohol dehydrogenase n=2 Tax=Lachnospiraceae TaxID=186803 RepID=A0A923LAQ1_9FIRM|nr:iron-containing alcohol dehydrogenase [Anaerosacchariphilus hominis]MBC5698977.1 iron-containing alcohol dehydrogenase [Roseburia difficilis]
MNNFGFYNRTKIIYGREEHKTVGERLKPYAKKVLLHYGGGSIKKNGIYDDIVKSLQEAGIDFCELGRVKPNPNPTLDLVYEGIDLCRKENIDCILAVGGGSAIDSGKAIACRVPYDGDVWELFGGYFVKTHLPIVTVLTLPASGTESSNNEVITNEKTLQKYYVGAKDFYPIFSIINPEIFYTVPKKQISAGAMDMMSHTIERCFSNTEHTDYVDQLSETALKIIMKYGEMLLKDSENYDAWFEFALAGTFSHNGIICIGKEEDWSNHRIEDELAVTCDITHGEGLSVITLAWMEYVY